MEKMAIPVIQHCLNNCIHSTGVFDRQYTTALDNLTEYEGKLRSTDASPSAMTLYCRSYFKQLNI